MSARSARSKKQVIVEPKEPKPEPVEVEATPFVDTPRPKRSTAQPKLTSFFGSAAKSKPATPAGSVAGKSGTSEIKEEPLSPVASPKKTPGGKSAEKENGSTSSKAVSEVKEEPLDEDEIEAMKAAKEKTEKADKKVKKEKENEEEEEELEEEQEPEDEDEEYEVERIVSHSWDEEGVLKYGVKWVGFDDVTHEPAENLSEASEKIEEYLKKLPKKARDEFEKNTKKPIGGSAKGGKKRPLSETIPNAKNVKEAAEKKKKVTKEVKQEPKERVPLEDRIAIIEKTRKMAFEMSTQDGIGTVVQRAAEALIKMMKTGMDYEKMRLANQALRNEREQCLKADEASGIKDNHRDLLYKLCEKIETTLDFLATREEKRREAEKKAASAEKEVKTEEDDLMGDSQVGEKQGAQVSEQNNDALSEVKEEIDAY